MFNSYHKTHILKVVFKIFEASVYYILKDNALFASKESFKSFRISGLQIEFLCVGNASFSFPEPRESQDLTEQRSLCAHQFSGSRRGVTCALAHCSLHFLWFSLETKVSPFTSSEAGPARCGAGHRCRRSAASSSSPAALL